MAVTAVSDLNSLFNTIYDNALFVAREQNLMAGLVDNRSATGWMNRVVPTRPAITAQTVAETQDFSAPTTFGRTTKATLTPGEVIAQVVLTDRDMETDPDSAMRDAQLELGASMATKIDVDLCSTFSSFTASKGTANTSLALANLGAALAVLGNAKARQYGQPVAVLHPYQWHDIWTVIGNPTGGSVNFDAMTSQALRDYYVGSLMGITIFTSANIAADSSDDAYGAVFVRPAIMLDTRRAIRFEEERDASARAWELNVTAGYAYGVVRDEFGVKILSDVSTPT
jgi:hypothetical protein